MSHCFDTPCYYLALLQTHFTVTLQSSLPGMEQCFSIAMGCRSPFAAPLGFALYFLLWAPACCYSLFSARSLPLASLIEFASSLPHDSFQDYLHDAQFCIMSLICLPQRGQCLSHYHTVCCHFTLLKYRWSGKMVSMVWTSRCKVLYELYCTAH